MDVLAGNMLIKVNWDLYLLWSLAMTRPQSTLLLLNLSLLNIQKNICKESLGRFSKPKFSSLTAFVKSHWRPDYLTSIVVSPTWNAITSSSSVKITLPPPELKAPTAFSLQHPSFGTASTSVGNNINRSARLKAQSPSSEKSLRPSFVKA